MTRFLTILLLFYSLSLIHTQQASEYETVKPPFNQNAELTLSQTKLYRIDLIDRRTDLDLALLALAYRGTAPKVYASKNPDQLVTPDQAPYSSKDMVGEVISIHSDYFSDPQSSLYVKLVCEAPECFSTITFDYSKELKLDANGYRFYQRAEDIRGATLGIVRLQLPVVADAERIVIHAEAIPAANQPNVPQFDVLIEQGDKIPHTSRVSNIQRTAWFEGKTIVIPKDHPLFCATCNYTLSLKLSEGIAISVSANVFGPNTALTAAPILDGVQKEKYNSYVFNIRDPEDEFIIDVGLQHGNVTLYIDCGNNIQNNFFLYYWRYEIKPQEEIVLTPREHSKCQNSPYYLVVYGHADSVYSIRGLWRPSSTLELRTGAQTVGDIFPGESITYELVVPIFIADEFMIDMEVSSEIEFNVNNCKFPSDCPGLIPAQMEATPTVDTLHKNDSFQFDWVSVKEPNRRIIINPHTGGCYPILIKDRRFMDGPIPVCAYQVILHSLQQLPVEYKLKIISRGHEWMYPGLSKVDSLGEGDMRNYMLYVPHQGVSQVTIQITKFSGEVSAYVSMTEKYPNETTTNVKFSHEGMIVFKDPPLNGTYYITVQGEETSSYSISAFIRNTDGKMEDYALPLKESVPQKGVVLPKHEHPVVYYKIILDLDEKWNGTLGIALSPARGSLVMVVNSNNVIPLPTVSNWNTTKHHLEISSDDPLFKRDGVYHIGIYMDWSNQEALGWDDIPFTIVYYLQETIEGQVSNRNHLMLSSTIPFHGKIKKDEVKYFEVSISPRDNEVTIYKQSDAGGVDLYVSREPTIEYPGPDSYTYTTALTHTNSLTLDSYDIREICQESMVLVVCTFYMSVYPTSDDLAETSFSLYLKREFKNSQLTTKIALEDGKRLILDAPEEDETPTIFYFYPHSRQPSVVTVACPGKHITIYAAKKHIEIGSSLEPELEAPWAEDPSSYSYSSKDNKVDTIGLAHLTIPSQTEINATVVTLAVYFKTLSNTSSEYSIVVSSQSTRIYTGQPYYGSVQNDSYVYFYFDVSKTDCNLLVALTTLDDGNPDLLVSYGENLRPTVGDSQFSSISDQRTEVIEVGNLDILPLKSMAGTWSIGVYGRTASSFTLTAIYEDQKTVELKSGIPFEMLLAENSKMYFKYYHEQNNSLEFKLERFSGDLEAYIINVDQNENFQPHLPNNSYYDWKIDAQYESTLKINPTDKEACTNCLYLIGLQTGAASKFVFNVLEDVKFVKLQNGIHYREEQEANSTKSYVFTSPNANEVFMNLYLFGSELRVYSSHNPTINTTNYDKVQKITQDAPSFQLAEGKGNFTEGQTVWDGTQLVPSEKNSFYFVFENPTTESIKYNFIMRTQDTNIILRPGDRADTYLGGGNQTSWVFYSSYSDEVIKLLIDFHVQSEEAPEQIQDIAQTGLPVEAKYWAGKETQGEGKVVDMDRAKVIDDLPTLNHIHNFRQVLSTISKKGKYVFNIGNPFNGNMVLGVRLFRSEVGALTLEQNSEHSSSLVTANKESLEIFLGNRGTWYLWVYSCAGEVELSVQDSSKELELESSTVILPQGQHHLFTAFHPRGGVKVVTVSKNPGAKGDTEFYMSSSFFSEGKVYDFEPENEDYHAKVGYENGAVQVSLTPVQFTELDAGDYVIYSIKVCPYDENNKEYQRNTCRASSDCLINNQNFQVNLQQSSVNAVFENVKEGNYYVKTVANIYHKDKLIRFVPYALKTLEAKAKSFLETGVESGSKTGLIWVGLVAVVVLAVLGYWGYGKLKNFGGKTGVEMQNFPQKKQQYEAVEEEEDQTVEEGGEPSQEKSEEK